ncbi:MAG: helix-turn-helix domain-containing protein [Desulfobulbus sp.]|jgi:predicted DNA-binding transcriptional regulator AlpA|nr:helix-turn-helix domain-containing protein [Desulfobulbus sp.]
MKQELREKNLQVGNSELLTPETTANLLGVKPATLCVWRCVRRYPLPWVKIGARRVMYRRADVEAFIAAGAVGE